MIIEREQHNKRERVSVSLFLILYAHHPNSTFMEPRNEIRLLSKEKDRVGIHVPLTLF